MQGKREKAEGTGGGGGVGGRQFEALTSCKITQTKSAELLEGKVSGQYPFSKNAAT